MFSRLLEESGGIFCAFSVVSWRDILHSARNLQRNKNIGNAVFSSELSFRVAELYRRTKHTSGASLKIPIVFPLLLLSVESAQRKQ
mmetsp:Transcript_13390/g.27238  ORF Transcript_13390/g.27238 Transcript_13390/m.27238 type:complete len:86 (-) Transcript_13390:59-316(-)